jgi:rhodanese-related sulfurtransferase
VIDLPAQSSETARRREVGCYVAASEAVAWSRRPDVAVIDTRSTAAFETLRIPGAMNLPSRVLRTKTFLRSKRILLVDEGWSGAELEETCRTLRGQGFERISILEGGLRAWAGEGGSLEGSPAARLALDRIPPDGLFRATRENHWLVVDVSQGGVPESIALPGTQRIDFDRGRLAFRNDLIRAIRERQPSAEGALFVAFADDDGAAVPEIERAIEGLEIRHRWMLDGGWRAYAAFRETHARMIAARAAEPKSRCARR